MGRARFFTVEEAARVLRIGRTAAYAAAKRYRATGGAEGLPVVVICGSLRVPGGWLETMAGGPIDLEELADRATSLHNRRAPRHAANVAPAPERAPKPKTATYPAQHTLPFSG